jgi:DNA-binding SARP family transcriptional activator
MAAPGQLVVRLLGTPQVERNGEAVTAPRGRKCWALLAYLLLRERPVSRLSLAELLFPDAEDPLRALRWSLVELRRALGGSEILHGDPLQLDLPPGTEVDVLALTGDAPSTSVGDGELLEGADFGATPAFDSWLAVERRRLAGIYAQLLRGEALSRLAEGDTAEAARLAGLCVARDPLDENHQELLVRCLAADGDELAALRQVEVSTKLFRDELGREPGPALRDAAGAGVVLSPPAGGDAAAAQAQLDAGHAAIEAGAVEPGIDCLRLSCAEAQAAGDTGLHARCLVALGTALAHSVRGRDGEAAAALRAALTVGDGNPERETAVAACRELGFVESQAGRVSSAGRWLARATELASTNAEQCSVLSVRALTLSDRAHYEAALRLADESTQRALQAGDRRIAAYSLSLAGRVHLLRGDVGRAQATLWRCLTHVTATGWVGLRPWAEIMLAEVELITGRTEAARKRLDTAYDLACRLGDPCWEGMGARANGLLHQAAGELEFARDWFAEARRRSSRVSDRYVWVYAHSLDAAAGVAIELGDAEARGLVAELTELAARSGMRELVVRARLHASRLGEPGALEAARLLAADIDNPALAHLLREPALTA